MKKLILKKKKMVFKKKTKNEPTRKTKGSKYV